jgi:dTDP-4-amino-4,6-dideoxygalactose transaminase
MNSWNAMEQFQKMSHSQNVLLTTRAATAIYLSLKTFSGSGKIVMPSTICLSPIVAAMEAGYEIEFVGVRNFQVDLTTTANLINSDPSINAVLLPELYGYPLQGLKDFWNKVAHRNLLLIEDLAQTLGKSRLNELSGKPTVVSVYSFGKSKVVESIRCGMITTKDNSFFSELESNYNALPFDLPTEYQKHLDTYNLLYAKLLSSPHPNRNWANFYKAAMSIDRTLYTPKIQQTIATEGIDLFPKSLTKERNSRHYWVSDQLTEFDFIKQPENFEPIGPIWRTTILVPAMVRDEIVEKIRSHQQPVSTWYKAMHRLVADVNGDSDDSLKEAEQFEAGVINLFLDVEEFDSYVQLLVSVMREYN